MLAASRRRPRSVSPCRRRAAKSAEQPTRTSRPAPSPSSQQLDQAGPPLPAAPRPPPLDGRPPERRCPPRGRRSRGWTPSCRRTRRGARGCRRPGAARRPPPRLGLTASTPDLGQRPRRSACGDRGHRAGDHRPGRAGAGAGPASHAAFGVEDDGAEGEDALGNADRTARGVAGDAMESRGQVTATGPGRRRVEHRRVEPAVLAHGAGGAGARRSARNRRRARRGAPPRSPSPRALTAGRRSRRARRRSACRGR